MATTEWPASLAGATPTAAGECQRPGGRQGDEVWACAHCRASWWPGHETAPQSLSLLLTRRLGCACPARRGRACTAVVAAGAQGPVLFLLRLLRPPGARRLPGQQVRGQTSARAGCPRIGAAARRSPFRPACVQRALRVLGTRGCWVGAGPTLPDLGCPGSRMAGARRAGHRLRVGHFSSCVCGAMRTCRG